MNNIKSSKAKDGLIIFFIILVFLSVIFILYTELQKSYLINSTEKNFYFVKEELENEVSKCKDINQKWAFGFSCNQKPSIKDISDYFNKNKKLINPHNKRIGVSGNAGSVQIEINDKVIIIYIDTDANGGIDINHKIYFN